MIIDNITITNVKGVTEYKELMSKQTTEVVKYNFDIMVNYMFLASMKSKEQQKMIITQLDICADLLYIRTVMNKDKKSNKHVH
jgi:succinate-acetate transporter protein